MSNQTTEATASFTRADAEDAGWIIVHEVIDAETEGVTLNSTVFRAEKYLTQPGRAGTYVEAFGHTEEGLLASIAFREQQFSPSDGKDVIVPAEDEAAGDVDSSDESQIERVSADDIAAARQNDTLTVLSDPEDPESEPVQKVIAGGNEVDESTLSEAHEPNSQAEAEQVEANEAGIASAKESRDSADSVEEADGADASAAAAQARNDAQGGDEGDSGNDPELVQPAAGEATDASDSEQQGQVPDSEAAQSDAVGTNADDNLPATHEQEEIAGPDTDAEAPAPAPNAQQ